jgi:hypothetical protein
MDLISGTGNNGEEFIGAEGMTMTLVHVSAEARDDLDKLSAGALHWIRHNIKFLDLDSAIKLPTTPKVKAILELALLRHIWEGLRPGDDGLAEITAFVRKIWQSPEFPQLMAADSTWAQHHALIYAAVPPPGVTTEFHRTALAELAAEAYLTAHGKSPHLRLATRYYADLAGVDHGIESYAELYAVSPLATRTTALPVTEHDAYDLTHAIFYLSAFGFRDPGIAPDDRERAHGIVCQLTEHFAQHDHWDLVGQFVLAQFCLGGDPVNTPSGLAGIQRLRHVQLHNGAIPARSVALFSEKSEGEIDFFRKAYRVTLVVALASLIISSSPRA